MYECTYILLTTGPNNHTHTHTHTHIHTHTHTHTHTVVKLMIDNPHHYQPWVELTEPFTPPRWYLWISIAPQAWHQTKLESHHKIFTVNGGFDKPSHCFTNILTSNHSYARTPRLTKQNKLRRSLRTAARCSRTTSLQPKHVPTTSAAWRVKTQGSKLTTPYHMWHACVSK